MKDNRHVICGTIVFCGCVDWQEKSPMSQPKNIHPIAVDDILRVKIWRQRMFPMRLFILCDFENCCEAELVHTYTFSRWSCHNTLFFLYAYKCCNHCREITLKSMTPYDWVRDRGRGRVVEEKEKTKTAAVTAKRCNDCVGGRNENRVASGSSILKSFQITFNALFHSLCFFSSYIKKLSCNGGKIARSSNKSTCDKAVKLRVMPIYEKWIQAEELFGCLELKPGYWSIKSILWRGVLGIKAAPTDTACWPQYKSQTPCQKVV